MSKCSRKRHKITWVDPPPPLLCCVEDFSFFGIVVFPLELVPAFISFASKSKRTAAAVKPSTASLPILILIRAEMFLGRLYTDLLTVLGRCWQRPQTRNGHATRTVFSSGAPHRRDSALTGSQSYKTTRTYLTFSPKSIQFLSGMSVMPLNLGKPIYQLPVCLFLLSCTASPFLV